MSIRFFVGIAIAVALGVNWGLKLHENPHYFDNLLSIFWSLLRMLLFIGAILGVIWVAIYGVIRVINSVSDIEIPQWIDDAIGYVFLSVIALGLIRTWWKMIKEKGGFKKRWGDKKKKRAERKKEIANLKGEEKKKYEKRKKDRIIIAVCLGWLPILWIVIIILSLFNSK